MNIIKNSLQIKEATKMELLKNLTLFIIKTIIILLLSMLFVSNIQIQQCNTNGDIVGMYNIVNCYNVLHKGFWGMK